MIYKVKHLAALVDNDGSVYSIPSNYITSVNTSITTNFQSSTELLLGVAPPPTAEITIKKVANSDVAAYHTAISRNGDYRSLTLHVFVSFDNGQTYVTKFSGFVKSRKESYGTVTLGATGFLGLLDLFKLNTPLMRWKRTATTIPQTGSLQDILDSQDPTTNDVGVINSVLWEIGGRPLRCRQLFDDNTQGYQPKFYYDCDGSVINPEWTWFNNDNLLNDLESLCRASGGVLYQREDGVVLYKNIYSIPSNEPEAVYTDSVYEDLEIGESRYEPYSKVILTFTPRYLTSSQEVYSEVLDEFLYPNQILVKTIEFQKPVYRLVNNTTSGQLGDTLVSAVYQKDSEIVEASSASLTKLSVYFKITPYSGWYTPTYTFTGNLGQFNEVPSTSTVTSQSAEIMILNSGVLVDLTVHLGRMRLFGRSLEGAKPQNYIRQIPITSGVLSGFKELRLNENPYIQDYTNARRYTHLSEYLLSNPRQVLTLKSVPADRAVTVGSIVEVNSTSMAVSGLYRVTSVGYELNTQACTLSVISTSGLIGRESVYIVGSGYSLDDTRYLGF